MRLGLKTQKSLEREVLLCHLEYLAPIFRFIKSRICSNPVCRHGFTSAEVFGSSGTGGPQWSEASRVWVHARTYTYVHLCPVLSPKPAPKPSTPKPSYFLLIYVPGLCHCCRCAPGTYSNVSGATDESTCQACPMGTYQPIKDPRFDGFGCRSFLS